MVSVEKKKSERMILLSSKGEEEGQQYCHTIGLHWLRSSFRIPRVQLQFRARSWVRVSLWDLLLNLLYLSRRYRHLLQRNEQLGCNCDTDTSPSRREVSIIQVKSNQHDKVKITLSEYLLAHVSGRFSQISAGQIEFKNQTEFEIQHPNCQPNILATGL